MDAPGARIERDVNGRPIGLCREYRKIIEKVIPPPTLEERKAAGLRAQAEALRYGVTGVHTCETLAEWDALAALEAEGKLRIRVHHTLPPEEVEKAKTRGIELTKGSDRLWFGQVKLFADGTLGSSTALLHAPYTDDAVQDGSGVSHGRRDAGADRAGLPARRRCGRARHRRSGHDQRPQRHRGGAEAIPRAEAGPGRARAAHAPQRLRPVPGHGRGGVVPAGPSAHRHARGGAEVGNGPLPVRLRLEVHASGRASGCSSARTRRSSTSTRCSASTPR